MSTQTQLEEALAQVKLLEKKLSESCEKESNLLKIKIENRKNTDVLNRIIEHNPYSIQILNADGYHIRENKAFLNLFKTVPDEKWSILQDPQIKESGLGELLQHVLKGELVQTPPVWYNAHFVDPKYPDHRVCIGSVIFPVFLSDGSLEFIVLMHEDITDRMVAREELKNSEQRLRHLLSSNPAVIYTSKVAPPYNWTFISDNVLDLTGFVSGDFINNHNFWSDHIHPDDWQKVMDELPLVLERGIHIMEYRFRCKDGHDIWILDETKLINDSQGNPLEMIGYWIDNTNRKLAEIELMEARNNAEESDRLKSAFLANMSHEVRTPLNSIIGFSELLVDPDFEEDLKNEFIKHIIASGNNLLTIISDIMDISKMESGEITVRKKPINAHEYVLGIYEQFSFQAETHKLEFILNLPDNDKKTEIFADTERLRQIFNNLIGNAFKFTVDGSIEIGYRPKGEMVEFFVKDTGIGIPASYHDKIFDRFRQVEDKKNRKYGGNGLGLAITKNLVGLMGGKIWVDCNEGKGSAFYFTMPCHY